MALPIPLKPIKNLTLHALKLTRAIEADPRHKAVETLLKKDCKPLWEKSTLKVAHILPFPSLESSLKALINRKQLERGLEHISLFLDREQKGLAATQSKKGTQPSLRVSRLFIVASDGSERFYRDCEKILLRHSDRVLLIRIGLTSNDLAQALLGATDKSLKALLISDRDAVTQILLSLVEDVQPE